MLSWGDFTRARPDLAAIGRSLFYEHASAIGLGFLATVRADGGPRVHPICPLLADDGLFGFIVPGPKLDDLRRDSRYALHSETFPPPDHDDAFAVIGRAVWADAPDVRQSLTQQFLAERQLDTPWDGFDAEELVEFKLERCLLTLTQPRDDFPAGHTIWHEGRDGR